MPGPLLIDLSVIAAQSGPRRRRFDDEKCDGAADADGDQRDRQRLPSVSNQPPGEYQAERERPIGELHPSRRPPPAPLQLACVGPCEEPEVRPKQYSDDGADEAHDEEGATGRSDDAARGP